MFIIVILFALAVTCCVVAAKKIKKNKGRELISVVKCAEETKHRSGLGRAAVGGALFGVGGAVVGAATAKDEEYVTFKAEYSDGSVEKRRVKVGSAEYKLWMKNMELVNAQK